MPLPLKTILIDDESLAVSRLRRLLGKHSDSIDIIGDAANGAEGLTLIESLQPDLIFLDIEMPLLKRLRDAVSPDNHADGGVCHRF